MTSTTSSVTTAPINQGLFFVGGGGPNATIGIVVVGAGWFEEFAVGCCPGGTGEEVINGTTGTIGSADGLGTRAAAQATQKTSLSTLTV